MLDRHGKIVPKGAYQVEIRVLRYFLAVAQEESISRAAQYLNLTQPTLSRQLMDLEQALGRQLLLRGKRKVTLTEDGLLLRKRAGEIVELVDKTESELCRSDEAVSGDICIGAGETDAMRLVGQVAKALQRDHPGIRYHLHSGNAEDVTERLDKGLLDFGILIEPVDIQKYDYVRLPATDVWGLLMPRDCPLAHRASIRPEDLWDLPLITSRQTLVKHDFSNWLHRDMGSLNVVTSYNLVYNAALMVEEGLGYALTLDKLVNTNGSRLCFRPLEPRMEVGLDLVWKKYQVFSKAAALFLSRLEQRFTQRQ